MILSVEVFHFHLTLNSKQVRHGMSPCQPCVGVVFVILETRVYQRGFTRWAQVRKQHPLPVKLV